MLKRLADELAEIAKIRSTGGTCITLSRAAALAILAADVVPAGCDIMSYEYGKDSCGADELDYWTGVTIDDIDTLTAYPDDYVTFQIWRQK